MEYRSTISMKKINVAINGFGRIGRAVFKAFLLKNSNVSIVAINDLTSVDTLAHLLKYDTSYGEFEGGIKVEKGDLLVGGKKYKMFAEKDPSLLPWAKLDVDVVIESTGFFTTSEKAGLHIKAGAKRVIISAPAKSDDIKTIVMGVNEDKLKKTDKVISNASCTTNCLAPVMEVIRQSFGIEKAIMTTIHSYTSSQNLVDGPHKDLRRSRAAAMNIIPTTTGAAIATAKVIPSLVGKFDGMSVRVPVPVGSLSDIVILTKKNVDESKVNTVLKKASESAKLKYILDVTDESIVSSDIIGQSASVVVDMQCTKVVGGNLLKVIAWYDNEWGYSNRLVDLVEYIQRKGF